MVEAIKEVDLLSITLPIVVYVILITLVIVGWNFANKFLSQLDAEMVLQRTEMESVLADVEVGNLEVICQNLDHITRSNRYGWILLILTIFYSVPVFQFVIRFLENDKDQCCFNDECVVPLGRFQDFGGFFSNISYVMFGVAFIVFVYLRQRSFRRLKLQIGTTHGIRLHFGIFYALGVALISEGVFSASYHICPNQQNFQFDTSFMYAMALLGYVAIYHMRHNKNYNYGAITIYITLGFFVVSTAIGLVTDGFYMGIIFSIFYLIGSFVFLKFLMEVKRNLIIFALVCNAVLVLVFWLRKDAENFGSRVLLIVLPNLIFHMIYYLVMKANHDYEHRSSRLTQPIIYMLISVACWIPGGIYFENSPKTWNKLGECAQTAEKCVGDSIFDVHDIWHFLSAPGLFFSFMMLLTIDDHMMQVSRNEIKVF